MNDSYKSCRVTVPISRKSELREAGFTVDQLSVVGSNVILDVYGPSVWVDALDVLLSDCWTDHTVVQFLTDLFGDDYTAELAVRALDSDR